jgi:hypothetical protein
VLVLHFLAGEPAGEHALVEVAQVNVVEVPQDDRQHRQQRLAAVGGLGRRDPLAWQPAGSGNRVPHHEPGDGHDQRAPYHRQVFGLLSVGIAAVVRLALAQAQVELHVVEQVPEVLGDGRHRERRAHHEEPVGHRQEMVDAFNKQHDGGDAV